MKRDWPAGELIFRFSIGGIAEKAEGIDGVGLLFCVYGDEPKAAAFLVGLFVAVFLCGNDGVSYGKNIDFVSAAIDELASV